MKYSFTLSILILIAGIPHGQPIDIGTADQVIVDDQAGKNNVATYNFFKALNKPNPSIPELEKIITDHVDLNARTGTNESALTIVTQTMDNIENCKKIIIYLLNKGVALNNKNANNGTFWYLLTDESPLKKFNDAETELTKVYNDHNTLFGDEIDPIKKILSDPDIAVNVRYDLRGETPLIKIVSSTILTPDIVQTLLEKGADPSLTDASGFNAVFTAALQKSAQLQILFREVQKIIDAKSNPNLEEQKNKAITHINKIDDKNTETILHIAFRNENLYTNSELVKKLIMRGDYLNQVCYGETPLEMFLNLKNKIAENAYNEIADKLIKAMTVDQLNFSHDNKGTALFQAVKNNNNVVADQLIVRAIDGVDINKDFPIGEAVQKNNTTIYLELDNAGAQKSTLKGETIFHRISNNISDDFLDLLVRDSDASKLINIQNKDDENSAPLHKVIKENSKKDIIDKLITIQNIDLNIQDSIGNTPLHYACKGIRVNDINCSEIARILLEKGADRTKQNSAGHKPFNLLDNPLTQHDINAITARLEAIKPSSSGVMGTGTTGAGSAGGTKESKQLSTKLGDLKNSLDELKEKLKSLSKKLINLQTKLVNQTFVW